MRGDVLVNEQDMIVLVKWSKTLQATNQRSYIVLPKLKFEKLCPVFNFQQLFHLYPTHPNAPCFSWDNVIVSENMLRQHFKNILEILHLDTTVFSFHTFRRSGATLAYNSDISMENIHRHGTWKSHAVNSYSVEDPQGASGLARSLQKVFNQW